MENKKITAEIVSDLYQKYDNKQHFLSLFGTKKFHLQDDDFLERMYIFLIKKVK